MGEIIVYDSGIGGIPVLCQLQKCFPKEEFIYFSDPQHMPYGEKTEKELSQIVTENFKIFQTYAPKAVVVACNTMSGVIEGQNSIRASYPIFCIKQPIEKALSEGKKKVLFLSTRRTAERICARLSFYKKENCKIFYSTNLASVIECAFNSLSTEWVGRLFSSMHIEDYDTVFLGCTHYIWLKEVISKLHPHLEIEDGVDLLISNMKERMMGKEQSATLGAGQSKEVFMVNNDAFIGFYSGERKGEFQVKTDQSSSVHFVGEGSFKNQNAYLFFKKHLFNY